MNLIWLSIFISFFSTLIVTPYVIKYLKSIGIVGRDVNKINKPLVPEMGGITVLIGFLSGVFFFIWYRIFIEKNSGFILQLFALLSTVLIIFIIGLLDDISSINKKGFKKFGLKQWVKPLVTLPAAVPLMSIMAGDSTISIPFIGSVNLGILYPLVIIPIGIVGASNAINMLAGLNGLEAGLAFVLVSSLGIYSLIIGNTTIALISFIFSASVLAFLFFNWYPAKIFPGDSFTYMAGAFVASIAILGNMEKISVLFFIPWFLELFLKIRSKFKAENFGKIQKDGTLKPPYDKNYSLTHVVMRMGKFKEWEIVLILILFEFVICATFILLSPFF